MGACGGWASRALVGVGVEGSKVPRGERERERESLQFSDSSWCDSQLHFSLIMRSCVCLCMFLFMVIPGEEDEEDMWK